MVGLLIMKTETKHTPTLGETLDKYGEAYVTRAVNAFEKLERIAHYATFEKCDKTNNCLHCMAQDFYANAEAAQ